MKSIIFLTGLIIVLYNICYSSIIHVPSDQPTIQSAINTAVENDTVLVGQNIYFENINFSGKAITVASQFIIDNDSSHIYNTILNGSNPSHFDSGSVVFMVSGEDTNSVLCGFTIKGGTGTVITDSIDFPARVAGAILAFSGGTIRNNIIVNNCISNFIIGAGGAIFSGLNGNGYLILEKNHISNNVINVDEQAVGGGVAMYNINGRIHDNVISKNHTTINGSITTRIAGGGIFCESDYNQIKTVTIKKNQIFNNSAKGGADLLDSHGGGISSWFTQVIVQNNTINFNSIDNKYSSNGAAISLSYCRNGTIVENNKIYGNHISSTSQGFGAVSVYESDSIIISNNVIYNNHIKNGGGIYGFFTNHLRIKANNIHHNISSNNGGGIYTSFCNSYLTNNIITHNSALYGGGISIYSSYEKITTKTLESKKAFCRQTNNQHKNILINTTPVIVNNTITENSSRAYGGGIYANSDSLIVLNSIIWNNYANAADQIHSENTSIQLAYCDVQDTLWPGIGNINADPFFSDSTYNLEDISPCISTGTNSVALNGKWFIAPQIDYDGDKRPMPAGSLTDIGAQEFQLTIVNITNSINNKPDKFKLLQNYPNPFNPETTIEISLPSSQFVTLTIFNLLGQEVAKIFSGKLQQGNHQYIWNASQMASGIYLYQLKAGSFIKTKKLIVLD